MKIQLKNNLPSKAKKKKKKYDKSFLDALEKAGHWKNIMYLYIPLVKSYTLKSWNLK